MTLKDRMLDLVVKKDALRVATEDYNSHHKTLMKLFEQLEACGPFVVDDYVFTFVKGQLEFEKIEPLLDDPCL